MRATGGDTHLGGEDFDNMVVDWALAELGAAKGADVAAAVKANARAVRRLRAACESAKRLLATATSAAIEVRRRLFETVCVRGCAGMCRGVNCSTVEFARGCEAERRLDAITEFLYYLLVKTSLHFRK